MRYTYCFTLNMSKDTKTTVVEVLRREARDTYDAAELTADEIDYNRLIRLGTELEEIANVVNGTSPEV